MAKPSTLPTERLPRALRPLAADFQGCATHARSACPARSERQRRGPQLPTFRAAQRSVARFSLLSPRSAVGSPLLLFWSSCTPERGPSERPGSTDSRRNALRHTRLEFPSLKDYDNAVHVQNTDTLHVRAFSIAISMATPS